MTPVSRPTFSPLASPERLWGVGVGDADVVEANPRRAVVDVMRLFVAAKIPVTLWGPVGARKTRTLEALAREVDENGVRYQVITIMPSTADPTTLHGLHYTTQAIDGATVMNRSLPDVAWQVHRYAQSTYLRTDADGSTTQVEVMLGEENHVFGDEGRASYSMTSRGGLTVMLLDEMTTCAPATQNALLGLLTHGKYGDLDISPYTAFVMAANPFGTVSTVNDLGEAVMNRGGHLAWYGDVKLFLEEWGSGFGDRSRAPGSKTAWYVRSLLSTAPEQAFRSQRWDPEDLVPEDRMEHTERVTTELAKMLELVEATFADQSDRLRHTYLIAVTRALMGRAWADRMAMVVGMESEMVSPQRIVEAVRAAHVGAATTFEELSAALGQGLHVHGGATLRQDQAQALMDDLVEAAGASPFSPDAYVGAWAFAISADEGTRAGMHAAMVTLARAGRDAALAGALERSALIPAFVPPEVRAVLRAQLAPAPAAAA